MNNLKQGDIFWLDLVGDGISHPHVVIQENVLNSSRIETTVVCALTTNQTKANMPGNVVLEIGEANLDKLSIVDVAAVWSVQKSQLTDYIGTLSEQRVSEILNGMRFLHKSFFGK